MRHGKLFDRNFALLQSTTNLLFIGAFQPQLNRFFDHRFRVFRCFSLADDAQLGTVCNIPTVLSGFDRSSELGKFHSQKFTLSSDLCQFPSPWQFHLDFRFRIAIARIWEHRPPACRIRQVWNIPPGLCSVRLTELHSHSQRTTSLRTSHGGSRQAAANYRPAARAPQRQVVMKC